MRCLKLSDTETSWHKATQYKMSQTVRQASTRQHRMRCLKLSYKLAQGNTEEMSQTVRQEGKATQDEMSQTVRH